MVKPDVYSMAGKKVRSITLPSQFSEAYRPDLIKRAVLATQSRKRQPYGSDPRAGLKTSAQYHGRKGAYGGQKNRDISRMPRITIRTGHLSWRARTSPHAVKGRKAHPPMAEKNFEKMMNKKERAKAVRSAIAATASREIVAGRGHALPERKSLPIVVDDRLDSLKKTGEMRKALESLGLAAELERCSARKVRAGKGTMRNRRYKTKKGPLLVIGEDRGAVKAAANIRGVDVVSVKELSAEALAPGTHPGRLAVWTEGAIKKLEKEKLFA